MKKLLVLGVLISGLFGTGSIEAREVINLKQGWRFLLGDGAYGVPDVDDSGWRVLDVPHDWSIEGKYDKRNPSGPQGGFMPCGTGWYRLHFEAPANSEGNRVLSASTGYI